MSDREHRFIVPPTLEGGTYANLLGTWHTAHELTLDFAVERRPILDVDDDDAAIAQVVARMRIPVTIAFEMIRVIHDELTAYEQRFGEVRRPGEPSEGS